MNHPVHYFVHVPKTAGVTIRNWLLQEFARDEVLFVYRGQIPEDRDALTFEVAEISRRAHELPATLRVFFGHFPFEPAWFVHPGCRGLGFVRDPRARIVSWKRYVERRGPVLPEPRMAVLAERFRAGAGLREVWDEVGGIDELDNGIVRHYANVTGAVGAVGEPELRRALDNVDRYFDFVGHVDWFDASMRRIAAALGRDYVAVPSRNESAGGRSEGAVDADADWIASLTGFDERFVRAVVERFPRPA